MFVTATICKLIFGLTQKFGPAQNILGPVKGQGIRLSQFSLVLGSGINVAP